MTNETTSRQCSKCKDNIGSFNCEGCKEIFCTKHSIEHRQEVCSRFEQLMTELTVIVQQTQDNEQQNESLKKQVDEWENKTIEKVRERAEQIRQQLDELVDNKNKMITDHIQPLIDETRRRYEKEDFFERDIERIKDNINQAQLSIDKSTQQSDIELDIESNHEIDWNHLIYIKDKSNTAISSVTSKQSEDEDNTETESTMNSNLIQDSNTYIPSFDPPLRPFMSAPRVMRSSYIPFIRPPNERDNFTYTQLHPYPPAQLIASHLYSIPNSNQSEKREKQPLHIVDPVSRKVIEPKTSFPFVDTDSVASLDDTVASSTSNLALETEKVKIQTEFRHQVAKLLVDNSSR